MKQETIKSPKNKASQDKDNLWVDVHNEAIMRELGFSRINVEPRDESVWTKTPKERELLKKLRNLYKNLDMRFHTPPRKFIKVPGKLIIQLRKNKVFPKTTYSIKCWKSDIPDILSNYVITNKRFNISESAILKYIWNGKTYNYNELPS